MEISNKYWCGFQMLSMRKQSQPWFHDFSNYFEKLEGQTEYKYSKFFMFIAIQMRVVLMYTSEAKNLEFISKFNASYVLYQVIFAYPVRIQIIY